MKRILYLLASVACVLAGCTLEPAERQLNSNAPVFTASYAEGGATRTQLGDNQTSVLWSEGDEISVFDGNKTNHEYVSSGPGKVTEFSLKGSGTVEPASEWIAIYPYDPDAERSAHSNLVTTILKSEYTQSRPGTFAEGMNLAIAQTSDASLNLSFKNALGYIAVAVKGASDVTRLTFRGNNDDGVAGPINIPFDLVAFNFTGKPTVPISKTLTLNIQNFEESTSKEAAKYYYIPVLPGYAFQKGFSIDVTKGDGDYTYTYDKSATFQRGEKRALFIEIPGGDDKYVDLVNEPLQWTTNLDAADPVCWDAKHRIYPDTHADLAWAEWTWNNGPETYEYPEGFPQLDVYKKRVRVYKCLFDNDALLLNVPVKEIPAGKTLTFDFCLRGGKWMPAAWTVEACLDGSNWVTMDVTGAKEGSTGIAYKDRNGDDRTAPLYMTKEDQEHYFRATTTPTAAVVKQTVQIRVRILIARGITSSLASTPTVNNNSNCHFSLAYYTLDGVKYFGPRLSVQ